MANNLFMEIDGIPGESEQDGYEGLVQIESWSWAMDQEGSAHRGGGSGTGRVDVGDLVVTKYTDKSTPIMYTKCATGEHINKIGLPIGYVASSVSCRARQTAELAFGGHDSLHRILVHTGPYKENSDVRTQLLVRFYKNLNIETGKNVIVSSHNSVIKCEMFIDDNCPKKLDLEEGGFYILSKSKKGIKLKYEFHNFNRFTRVFYER